MWSVTAQKYQMHCTWALLLASRDQAAAQETPAARALSPSGGGQWQGRSKGFYLPAQEFIQRCLANPPLAAYLARF